jgi:hypothetical protein
MTNAYTDSALTGGQVVAWFRSTRDDFRQQNGRTIPSLAFVHIPVGATYDFQQNGGLSSTAEPGINEEAIGRQGDSCDSTGNTCVYHGADTAFMQALVETEGLMAVFSGHDHGIEYVFRAAFYVPPQLTCIAGV